MINASVEFRKTMRQRTDFKPSASILFADGRMVNLTEHDLSINGNELTDGAESNSFPLGVAIGRAFSMEIRNQDQRFENYSFYMATVQLQLHFKLDSGTEETIYLGKFTITTPETYGTTITVQAVDDMYRANTSYSTQLIFPVTLGEMVRDCCSQCGLPLGSATFKNSNFSVKSKPENISCREVLAQAAMIAGGYAKVDRNGYLQICSYDLSIFEREGAGYGGSFDNSENVEFYVDGDNIDGGNFDDYSSGDTFDSGTFLSMDDFHMFYDFLSPPQTDADDVVITGIQITSTTGTTYLCGEEGYILSIENQLAKGNEQNAVNAIGKLINGFKFRAFSGEHIGYPLAEFGDICYVVDQNQNTYQSILTDTTYRFNGKTSLKCSADSPLRNSSKNAYNSDYIKAVIAARNYTDQEMSAYDLVVQQMSQLAANTLGFHETKIIQDDGSVIVYRHDKPKLSESKIVYKSGIDGFFVTRNYTGKDSTTVWTNGFDSNGNAALNILSVIGIHWDWAYGGTLTLGGEGNKNGVLRILNVNGAQIGKWDNTGADITGTIKTITSEGVYAKMTGQDIVFVNGNNDIDEQILMRIGATISTDDNFADINLGENTNFGIGGNGREILQIYPYDNWTTKILGNFEVISGTKSRIAETENFSDRLLYCYETPTPMFGDVGCAQTNAEGVSIIDIDPVFAETISTGTEYQVFLQKEGPGDLWIQEKDESYFVVRGTPELKFSWELKCSQKHFEHLRLEEETQRTMVSKDINNAENDYSDIIDGLVNDYDTEMEELINESN
ncbi:MAG: hypothetical protein ACLTX6_11580 [Lachnospiraceae bacterium]